jgi:hypothetical protein
MNGRRTTPADSNVVPRPGIDLTNIRNWIAQGAPNN